MTAWQRIRHSPFSFTRKVGDNSRFEVHSAVFDDRYGFCCPREETVSLFKWDGKTFVLQGPPIVRPIVTATATATVIAVPGRLSPQGQAYAKQVGPVIDRLRDNVMQVVLWAVPREAMSWSSETRQKWREDQDKYIAAVRQDIQEIRSVGLSPGEFSQVHRMLLVAVTKLQIAIADYLGGLENAKSGVPPGWGSINQAWNDDLPKVKVEFVRVSELYTQ